MRVVRQTAAAAPYPSYRKVGSPLPRRIGPRVAPRSTGRPGAQRRSRAAVGVPWVVTASVSQVPSVLLAATSTHSIERVDELVANKPKVQDRDRRAKIEAMRKAEQAKERRKSMIFVIVAIVVGVGLVAAVAIPSYVKSKNDPAKKSMSDFGVSLASASCSPVQTTKGTNTQELRQHVQDGTIEKYKTVPPSYGPHWASPIYPSREFYTVRDRPQMERLVHNLEHGYTMVWYDSTIKGDDLQELKDLAVSARKSDAGRARHEVHHLGVGRRLREVPVRQAHRDVALGRGGQPRPALRQGQRPGPGQVHDPVPVHRRPRAQRRLTRPPSPQMITVP